MQFRTEVLDDDSAHQRRLHGLGTLGAVPQYAPGPREHLLRALDGAWRPNHRPSTLREEIADSDLDPRQRLSLRIRDLWRGAR